MELQFYPSLWNPAARRRRPHPMRALESAIGSRNDRVIALHSIYIFGNAHRRHDGLCGNGMRIDTYGAGRRSRPDRFSEDIVRAWILLVAAGICLPIMPVRAAEIGQVRLTGIEVKPLQVRPNLVANHSFEVVDDHGIPEGWQWDRRNTDATCASATGKAFSGKRALHLTNGTPFGANVYGMLWRKEPLALVPGRSYTLSAWVNSAQGGISWIGGGKDWQIRLQVPQTRGAWRRVWLTFKASDDDREFVLRIATESPAPAVWMDDIKLEEGTEPTPVPPSDDASDAAQLSPLLPTTEIQGDGQFLTDFLLYTARPLKAEAQADWNTRSTTKHPITVEPGAWRIVVRGEAYAASDVPRPLTLKLTPGGGNTSLAAAQVRFFSRTGAVNRLAMLRVVLPALEKLRGKVAKRGRDTSYPDIEITVLRNFIGFVQEDLKHGEIRRALQQISELEPMADRAELEMSEVYAGRSAFPAVPRWTGMQRPQVKEMAIMAPARIGTGRPVVERPMFFNGYGHFGQVSADIEKFSGYGTNIIQIEIGPNSLFPSENHVDKGAIEELKRTLTRAQTAGVGVILLISPHYFPDWMLAKYPELKKRREGFLQYCIHAPESRELLQRYITIVVSELKDYPALHSICLSNEPVNVEEPCEYAAKEWHEWLTARHGDVATLNRHWQTNYAAIADAPLPDPFLPPPAPPIRIDYLRFNQEVFSNWHKMMADAVHAVAPDLPVHAKAMSWTMLNGSQARYGADAYLFGSWSQYNGNDSVNTYMFGSDEFAEGWRLNAMSHDLQRSVREAPVLNSENHVINDRETRVVPARHIYSTLWQEAVHGQGATAIWVWERSYDPNADTAGSILHRPACVEAVGRLNCDLNRAAPEIVALQSASPQITILHGVTPAAWEAERFDDCTEKLYTALASKGVNIGFITERQLEDGILPKTRALLVPDITHVSEKAYAALQGAHVRIVAVGDDAVLTHDEYGAPFSVKLPMDRVVYSYGKETWQNVRDRIATHLAEWGADSPIAARSPQGKPVEGVFWTWARVGSHLIVSLVNESHGSVRVKLFRKGRPVEATDVLTGGKTGSVITMPTMGTALLRVD